MQAKKHYFHKNFFLTLNIFLFPEPLEPVTDQLPGAPAPLAAAPGPAKTVVKYFSLTLVLYKLNICLIV